VPLGVPPVVWLPCASLPFPGRALVDRTDAPCVERAPGEYTPPPRGSTDGIL